MSVSESGLSWWTSSYSCSVTRFALGTQYKHSFALSNPVQLTHQESKMDTYKPSMDFLFSSTNLFILPFS